MNKILLICIALFSVLILLTSSSSFKESKIDNEVIEALKQSEEVPVILQIEDDLLSTTLTKEEIEILEELPSIQKIDYAHSFSTTLQDSVDIVNATRSWDLIENSFNLTGTDESVCVIDTGIDFEHPDLIGKNLTCVIDCFNKACVENCSIGDDNGHGTHVGGTIAASSGILGIAHSTKLIALKVLDNNGNSHSTNGEIDIKAAIDWCVENSIIYNISVISMSLGSTAQYSGECDSSFTSTLTSAINNATIYNISVVSATGNSGGGIPRNTTHIKSPACIANSTAVSATNKDDTIASYAHYNTETNFFAPGTSINSTYNSNGYASLQGTSMSTPHVAAAFALIRQFTRLQNGTVFQPFQIRQSLMENGANITVPAGFNISRINIYETIISLDSTNPIVNLSSPSDNSASPLINRTFVCNATDLSLGNVTFYLYNSSSNIINQTSQIITGSSQIINYNVSNISIGTYDWNCLYFDEGENSAFSTKNFTFTVGGISTSLTAPLNNNYTKNNLTSYECQTNSESTSSLVNLTFSLWNVSKTLVYNETKAVTGSVNSSTYYFNLTSETSYEWNCLSWNNNSNFSYAPSNFSLTYDISNPNITLLTPIDGQEDTGSTSYDFTFNITDILNISSCALILNSASVALNSSPSTSMSTIITYSVSPGSYNWYINCTDYAGNIGNSSSRSLTVNSVPASSSGGSSGGGGGGSSTTKIARTYLPSATDLSSGYTKELQELEKIKFFDALSEEHLLTIKEVTSDSVSITIESNPINLILAKGQSAKLSLLSPEIYDLYIKVDDIVGTKATLTIQLINEPIPSSVEEKPPEKFSTQDDDDQGIVEEKIKEITKISKPFFALFALVIIVLLFILFTVSWKMFKKAHIDIDKDYKSKVDSSKPKKKKKYKKLEKLNNQ